MKTSQFKIAMMIAMEAGLPLAAWGLSGIGKTQITGQAFKEVIERVRAKKSFINARIPEVNQWLDSGEFKATYHTILLAHMDMDAFGIPTKFAELRDENGTEYLKPMDALTATDHPIDYVHNYTRPNWWPRADYKGIWFLFMDEMNRGENYATNAVLEIGASHSFRGRQAPPGFMLGAACNPPIGNFQVREVEQAATARWAHVWVDTDPATYLDARFHVLDEVTRSVVGQCGANEFMKDTSLENWDVKEQVSLCPRTWEFLPKIHAYMAWLAQNDPARLQDELNTIHHMVIGCVGPTVGNMWMQSYNQQEFLTLEKFLTGEYNDLKNLANKNPLGINLLAYLVGTTLVDGDLSGKNRQNALTHVVNLFEYLRDNRKDLAIATINKLYTRAGKCPQVVQRLAQIPKMTELVIDMKVK